MADPVTPAPQQAPPQPAPPQPAPEGQVPVGPGGPDIAAQLGWLADEGVFVLPFGVGLRLTAEAIGDGKKKIEIAQQYLPKLPGLTIETAEFNPQSASAMVKFKGQTAIPLTDAKPYSISFRKSDGKPSDFSVKTQSTLEWMGKPSLSLSWTPAEGLKAEAVVKADKFVPKSLAKVATAQGDLTLSLANGMLSGTIDTTIATKDVLTAHLKGAFTTEGLAASVDLASNTKWLGEVKGQGAIDAAGQITARIDKAAGELPSLIPGLTFKGGMMSVVLNSDGTISGGFEGLTLDYAGLATATASFTIASGKLSGSADLALAIPGMNSATGKIAMNNGLLSGSFALGKDTFPEGLPLQSGSISGTISETGALAFKGSVGISLGPAGTGQLVASYSGAEGIAISATVDLAIPGLQAAKFTVAYDGTGISGEGELAVDPELLAGITGNAKVTYKEGLWAGEATLGYSADNGKLSGSITVRVRQAEDASLKVSGDGDVTAKIAPRLEGRLHATIKEEGGIDVSGEISVTEPIPMFPEYRVEKELLNISQSIPLWAILVAVLRIRAGVRAGIGPGVFRNIKITGSYTIGEEGEPSFAITGEMYIPAFVEGYVGFGAGLGLDVVLGSLTGGIEAMGTAGIYGAISVIPELAYENGDYSISGVATMAAGARLKLSLNAWAEVEALWITVWDNTWELASVTMPIGPDLGLQAKMAYTFGKPDPPTLDFSTSDIDTDRLVQDAMPKDGPPNTGTREAVKNEAKWQGAQKAKGPAADAVPPELQAQAATAPPVAEPKGGTAPGGKGAKPKAPDGSVKPVEDPTKIDPKTGQATDPATSAKQTAEAKSPDPAAAGTVADDKAADTKEPRHPAQVTIAMLDEPPAPMPRTKAQQEADVEAAAKMVQLVTTLVGDTDALDDYFAKIKARFVLSSIEFVITPGPNVSVLVKVNSEKMVTIKEEVRNLPSTDKDTKVKFTLAERTFNFGPDTPGGPDHKVTDKLGIKMVAESLTPLHPQGAGPSDAALGNIFNFLNTLGPTGAHGYIKGHLLNDNLGGPGQAENLYPITQQANADHANLIEDEAKKRVNQDHFWVRYEVDIQNEKVSNLPATPTMGKAISIDADMHAKLSILGTSGLEPTLIKSVVIKSRFNTTADQFGDKTAKELTKTEQAERDKAKEAFLKAPDTNPAAGAAPGATNESQVQTSVDVATLDPSKLKQVPVDQSLVQLSKAAGPGPTLFLEPKVLAAIRQVVAAAAIPDYLGRPDRSLKVRLEGAAGMGPARIATVIARGGAVLAAHAAAPGAPVDVGPLLASDAATFRAINTAATADDIAAIIAKFNAEAADAAALAKMPAQMKAADWKKFFGLFDTASQSDRTDFAAKVADKATATRVKDSSGYKAFKDEFRAAGGLSTDDPMMTAIRTKLGYGKES
jgi:hypothetical protein